MKSAKAISNPPPYPTAMLTARFYPAGGPVLLPHPPSSPCPLLFTADSVAVQPTNDDAAATPLAAAHGIKDHEIRVSSFAMHYVFGKKLAPRLSHRSTAFAPLLSPFPRFLSLLALSLFSLPPSGARLFRGRERERERAREKKKEDAGLSN